MSDRQRLLILAAFHYALVAAALTPPFLLFVAYDSAMVGAAMLVYLAVVVWWITRRAHSRLPFHPRSRMDAYITAGVRWGAIGGALYSGGILAPLLIWSTKIALFGPHPHEVPLLWEEWAFVWMAAIVVFVGTFAGTILGGVISIIDRGLLAVAHRIGLRRDAS